jgi:hypothetical protein
MPRMRAVWMLDPSSTSQACSTVVIFSPVSVS